MQITQKGVTLRHPSVPAPPVHMPFPPANPSSQLPLMPSTPAYRPIYGTSQFFGKRFPTVLSFATPEPPVDDYGFLDGQYHNLYKREKIIAKRDNANAEDTLVKVEGFESKKEVVKRNADFDKVTFVEREEPAENDKTLVKRDSDKKKRGLLQLSDGSVIDDAFLVPQSLNNDYFTGLASFGVQLPAHSTKSEEREPAEGEVRMVMNVCDGCTPDPFEKALIMDWRSVPKKVYSGALWLPAAQACKAF